MDALLIKLLLDERGLATSNPTPEDVAQNQAVVDQYIPIGKGLVGANKDWYWQVSSPCYLYQAEVTETIRRRWDQQERNLDWQGKRRSWSTSETHTKSWEVLIQERDTPRVDWFCLGEKDEILRLLALCQAIGKKRRTQVSTWECEEVAEDWHLWRNGQLMRPVPLELLEQAPLSFAIRQWAWRPPTHLPENVAKCAMPIGLAAKVEAVYGCA